MKPVGIILLASFTGLAVNILLLQYSYIHLMRSLGLDWNPFKTEIAGIRLRKGERIGKIIDHYLSTREFNPRHKKRLLFYKKWEMVTMILFIAFPILAFLLLLVNRK